MGEQGGGSGFGSGARRRRRRRRPGGPPQGQPPQGNGNNTSAPDPAQLHGSSGFSGGGSQGAGGARRRRSKFRGGRPSGTAGGNPQGPRPQAPGVMPQGEPTLEVVGVLQIMPDGSGFLRSAENDYNPVPGDPWVPRDLIATHAFETGVELRGMAVPPDRPGRSPVFMSLAAVNGGELERWVTRTPFKNLVAEDPTERIRLENDPTELSTRVVDIISPIGKGQRCLIVAPPKAGKTVLLQKIAKAITANHPEIHLIVLLVDERPEEVTDMRRNVRGEVLASSSDEMARNHVAVAEIALERAKRLVECGRDVIVLLDSITRLSRAYNNEQKGSGRILSGGIDARTMEKPRRFFGAARKCVQGGSLTVIGTALIDTGSRMDEVIFQEFKGTGNTEIVMDRNLFERRIFPAIDISQSGTRKEEKLYDPLDFPRITLLRRALAPLRSAEAMQLLVDRLGRYPTNREFLAHLLT